MNKKMFNIIFAFLIIIIGFCGVKYVDAASLVGSCKYGSAKGQIPSANPSVNIDVYDLYVEVILNNDNSFTAECKAKTSTAIYGCAIKDKNVSSLFANNNGKLYCPSNVYLNYESAGANVWYSLAKDKKDQYSIELKNPTPTGNAVNYTSEGSNGTLEGCKSNGKALKSSFDSKLNGYVSTIASYGNNLTLNTANQMKNNLTKLETEIFSYCDFVGDGSYVTRINNARSSLEAKVNSSEKISNSEKSTFESTINKEMSTSNKTRSNATKMDHDDTYKTCSAILDEDLVNVIKLVLKWVRILVPILLILLIAVDLSQAVISQEQDAIKKATSKVIKRAIAALGLFFIPLFVSLMLDWMGDAVRSSDGKIYFDRNEANCEVITK